MPRITRGVRARGCAFYLSRARLSRVEGVGARKTPQGPSLWPIGAQGAGCGARITSKLSRAPPRGVARGETAPCETANADGADGPVSLYAPVAAGALRCPGTASGALVDRALA
eukprot:scaffold3058_cov65-Phaeocystis_antarctica.AAC.3